MPGRLAQEPELRARIEGGKGPGVRPHVADRRGGDLNPLDPLRDAGRLTAPADRPG